MKRLGIKVGDKLLPGCICYGIPIRSERFFRDQLQHKVEEVAKGAEKVV